MINLIPKHLPAGGCFFFHWCLPVQTVAICGYLEPLSAVIFSAIFLNEIMGTVQIIGTVLISLYIAH